MLCICRLWVVVLDVSDVFVVAGLQIRGLLWPLASAWARLLRFAFTRRSAFFELSYPRTQLFHVHNAIIACLTQLLMNSDGFHATQMEESDNHALFFEINVAIEVSKTLLSLDDVTSIQRVGQGCHLASSNLKNSHAISNNFHVSSCFHSQENIYIYIGGLRTWMHHVSAHGSVSYAHSHESDCSLWQYCECYRLCKSLRA